MTIRECCVCGGLCFFDSGDRLLFPPTDANIPLPHKDMSPDIQNQYLEARSVAGVSPRAAGALIRLALQMLCEELTGTKGSINQMIGTLQTAGVPDRVIKAMDILRITGNRAVHPGQLNMEEDPITVHKIFGLLNLIVDEAIAKPREIEALYDELPEGALFAIKDRDRKSNLK